MQVCGSNTMQDHSSWKKALPLNILLFAYWKYWVLPTQWINPSSRVTTVSECNMSFREGRGQARESFLRNFMAGQEKKKKKKNLCWTGRHGNREA
ncbi:Protein of unknown function [Gryllus bimaculatus]|nr:Protein of unknown function [Gryllus bimaculatus]